MIDKSINDRTILPFDVPTEERGSLSEYREV